MRKRTTVDFDEEDYAEMMKQKGDLSVAQWARRAFAEKLEKDTTTDYIAVNNRQPAQGDG